MVSSASWTILVFLILEITIIISNAYELLNDDDNEVEVAEGGTRKWGTDDRKHRKWGTNEHRDCTQDLIYQVFDKPTTSSECPAEDMRKWPGFFHSDYITKIKTHYYGDRHKEYDIKHIEFLPMFYILNIWINGECQVVNYYLKKRNINNYIKHRSCIICAYGIGTEDEGRTLLIYFPGTDNINDVKIDIAVRHHTIKLPNIVAEERKYKFPEKFLSGQESPKLDKLALDHLYSFKVHHCVHSRLFDQEIQRGLQEDLLFLYSGFETMPKISFEEWYEHNNIDKPVVENYINMDLLFLKMM